MKLSFRIKRNSDVVFDYLTDMEKFASVHPVIFKIDNIGDEKYLVHETLKLGFIPFSFTYPITMESSVLKRVVVFHAKVFGLAKIEMKFVIKPDSDFTLIEEDIQFKLPLPIQFILQPIFQKQHNQLFQNIEMTRIESVVE